MIDVVITICPGFTGGDVDLLRFVPFVVVGIVPCAVAEDLIARAGDVTVVGAIAVGVVGPVVGAVGGELGLVVVGVVSRVAVVGLGSQLAGGVEGEGVVGDQVAGGVAMGQGGDAAGEVVV